MVWEYKCYLIRSGFETIFKVNLFGIRFQCQSFLHGFREARVWLQARSNQVSCVYGFGREIMHVIIKFFLYFKASVLNWCHWRRNRVVFWNSSVREFGILQVYGNVDYAIWSCNCLYFTARSFSKYIYLFNFDLLPLAWCCSWARLLFFIR